MKGLTYRKSVDAIATFVKQHGAAGPRRAVLCTYDLNPTRFEAVVLPEIARRRRWFRTLVLADQGALQKDGILRQRSAASTYELAPVRLKGPGVFHPKLIVLQAGPRVLVGVGSGNLTPGGLGGNLELMLFASNDSADGRALAGSAIQFLHDLSCARGIVLPPSAKRFLKRMCLSAARSAGGPILHNLDKSLITQFSTGLPAQIQRAAVVSPWHSSSASPEGIEPKVLLRVGQALGARPVVYTEGQKGKGPQLGAGIHVRVLKPIMRDNGEDLEAGDDGFDRPASAPRRSATLHAKAYLAVGKRDSTLWFGSANCTLPALLRSASGQGNVELLVRILLEKDDISAFETDLASMFDDRKGLLAPEKKTRVHAPLGCVLSGYVSSWRDQQHVTLELAGPATKARTLRIARSTKLATAIIVKVPGGVSSIVLDAKKLLDEGEAPPVLWEHIGRTAIPFPVSVPCFPSTNDAEQTLEDLLDDLAGRLPAAFSYRTRRGQPDNERSSDEENPDDNETDRELDLLTKTDHQGSLDRIAVRVEMLRRRLEAAVWGSAEAYAHYRGVIDALSLTPSVRKILGDHLGVGRGV